jgi:metallo-beta-lactamase class B
MKMRFAIFLLFISGLGMTSANAQQPAAESVDGHILAAQNAAGLEFPGLLDRLCILPASAANAPPPRPQPVSAQPRPTPDRSTWYAPPVKVFDNLYWVGTKIHSSWALKTSGGIILIDTLYNYASEPEIVGGLKTLGLDPATVKYVIVSHGHGDHDEGANLMQKEYHSRIIMGAPDWDAIEKANNMPGGTPTRDMVATDGEKLTLGDTTVTIVLTPGHTLGTLGLIFPVKDNGNPLTVVYSGGTAFNNQFDAARFQTYSASQQKLARLAANAGATVLLSNHSEFDDAYTKGRLLAARKPGEPNPFDIGREAVARYFNVADQCAQAALLEHKGS